MAKKPSADSAIFRVLDSNVNRCREGLRVIEDTLRFVLNNPSGFLRARRLRHSVDCISRSAYPRLIARRSTGTDLGRTVREKRRADITGLLIANFKRVEESLRVLEEYGTLIMPGAGPKFKRARFSAYELEKSVLQRICSR